MKLSEPALGPHHPVNRLRTAAAAVEEAAAAIPADQRKDVAWLLDCLSRYDDGAAAGLALDEALGLRARGAAGRWWAIEARAQRDRMLREIVARHYPGLEPLPAARAILTDLAMLDRQRSPPPESVTADLARAAAYATIPRSDKALSAIIAEV